MQVHIRINTEEALSTDELKELVRQSEAKGLRPEQLATAILRDGIRAELEASREPAAASATHREPIVDRTR